MRPHVEWSRSVLPAPTKDGSRPLDPGRGRHGRARRARTLTAIAAATTVALGVVAKLVVPGLAGDLLGSALYTVLLALLLAFVAPRLPVLVTAGTAAVASLGVELLQLTGLPAAAAATFPPAAWVLGTTFAATDLLGYLAGGVTGLVLLRALRRAS
ncbi:DUF2809 domain-containing protein [Frigoribacterium sp. PhB24]|uniref:DUF2809 domain-containing protein n=1 Tax=Frigoribacterium sp. PhB24 TaxID=2485204 RepID=UPI000FBE30B2|nr:DUF2809 domain-containing protein [Frigoribacterium sp. PhB24]ROS49449.1 uncharacterized protein DUF2809 [Frigoribacterium sp. PhB24]